MLQVVSLDFFKCTHVVSEVVFRLSLNLLFRVSVYLGLALPWAVKCVVTVLDVSLFLLQSYICCAFLPTRERESCSRQCVFLYFTARAVGPNRSLGYEAIGCVLYAVTFCVEQPGAFTIC